MLSSGEVNCQTTVSWHCPTWPHAGGGTIQPQSCKHRSALGATRSGRIRLFRFTRTLYNRNFLKPLTKLELLNRLKLVHFTYCFVYSTRHYCQNLHSYTPGHQSSGNVSDHENDINMIQHPRDTYTYSTAMVSCKRFTEFKYLNLFAYIAGMDFFSH